MLTETGNERKKTVNIYIFELRGGTKAKETDMEDDEDADEEEVEEKNSKAGKGPIHLHVYLSTWGKIGMGL